MMWSREGTDLGRPWFYLGRLPMYSAALLIAVFITAMVAVTITLAAGGESIVNALVLKRETVFTGRVWQLVTWPLVNFPDIWFAISMLFLYLIGRSVESVLGRVDFFKLVGVIAGVATGLTLLLPGARLAGSWSISFGVFLAFAIMHPSALVFPIVNLTAKWLALILLALNSLMAIASRDWTGLIQLWGVAVAAALGLKWLGAAPSLNWLTLPTLRLPARTRKPDSGAANASSSASVSPQDIDALLDKVAAQGLHSLTEAERRRLREASETLHRRQQ